MLRPGFARNKLLIWSVLAGSIVVAHLVARWLGPRLGVDRRLMMLGLMFAASGLLSIAIALQRRKLRYRMAQLPAHAREILAHLHPEFRYAQAHGNARWPSARTAVCIGSLWVSWAALPWIVVPLAAYQMLAGQRHLAIEAMLLLLGFVCAWSWWSVNVTLWRRWARRRGVDAG